MLAECRQAHQHGCRGQDAGRQHSRAACRLGDEHDRDSKRHEEQRRVGLDLDVPGPDASQPVVVDDPAGQGDRADRGRKPGARQAQLTARTRQVAGHSRERSMSGSAGRGRLDDNGIQQ
jgi:hypothetical protein